MPHPQVELETWAYLGNKPYLFTFFLLKTETTQINLVLKSKGKHSFVLA